MDTARVLTQLPVIMGLCSAALMLILILSLSTPFPSLCIPSHYSLPAIKSVCVDFACSMWTLLHPSTEQPVLLSFRSLFLLVNLIVLFLLISLHLHKHPPPAAGKRSSKKKKLQHNTRKLIVDDKQATPLQGSSLADDHTGRLAAAAMAKVEASPSSVCSSAEFDTEESLIAEAAARSMKKKLDEAQEIPTVDSDRINNVEQIVLEEDGRLRLIGGGDTKGSDSEKSESGGLGLIESGNGSDAEMIVQEEDGGIEPNLKGSDEEKIVLEEDGRLRLIDRPQLLPSSSRPLKSHSTGDRNVDEPSDRIIPDANYDTHSLNNLNYDIETHCSLHSNHDSHSFNRDNSNLNEINNNGALVLDLSSNATSITNNLNQDTRINNKSFSTKRNSSRPMRPKKSDSLDATWKAITNNKGSAASSRDHKHLIRQSSRQDFKPNNRGLMRASNNIGKVRRDPSITQEEFNAKVESFIAKFNEQIRIQRQESLLSYMQMVDRGA